MSLFREPKIDDLERRIKALEEKWEVPFDGDPSYHWSHSAKYFTESIKDLSAQFRELYEFLKVRREIIPAKPPVGKLVSSKSK